MIDVLADNYVRLHLRSFMQTRYEDQGAFNPVSPRDWAFDVLGEWQPQLPATPMTRTALRSFCTSDADVLDCYLAVMAWGRQDAARAGRVRALNTWRRNQVAIRQHLEILRRERLNRAEAFSLFCGHGRIPGLGVAFFTKLLYFFAPPSPAGADRYILDQWTAKSLNLLAGKPVIHMCRSGAVTRRNTSEIYEAYCIELEALTALLNALHDDAPLRAEDVELMLFSSGGRGKPQRPWRQHVLTNWGKDATRERFSRRLTMDRARGLRELMNAMPHDS